MTKEDVFRFCKELERRAGVPVDPEKVWERLRERLA